MYFCGYHLAADACYTAGFGGITRVRTRREFSSFGECLQAFGWSVVQSVVRVLRAAERAPQNTRRITRSDRITRVALVVAEFHLFQFLLDVRQVNRYIYVCTLISKVRFAVLFVRDVAAT